MSSANDLHTRAHGSTRAPFFSVMIPVHNRTEYLGEAIDSILRQDPGSDEMQIVVVDDASTDVDVQAVLEKLGFTNRVEFVRLQSHECIGSAWNTCIRLAKGEWIHIMHDDDVVLSGYYSTLRDGVQSRPECGMMFCRISEVSETRRWLRDGPLEQATAGILPDHWVDRLIIGSRIACPSVVVKATVYEAVGTFRTDLAYSLDWEMWQRIALKFAVWYEPQILFHWRRHRGTESYKNIFTPRWLEEIRRTCESVRTRLPASKLHLYSDALIECSYQALWLSCKMIRAGLWKDASRSAASAFRVCVSPEESNWTTAQFIRARMCVGWIRFFVAKVCSASYSAARSTLPESLHPHPESDAASKP